MIKVTTSDRITVHIHDPSIWPNVPPYYEKSYHFFDKLSTETPISSVISAQIAQNIVIYAILKIMKYVLKFSNA